MKLIYPNDFKRFLFLAFVFPCTQGFAISLSSVAASYTYPATDKFSA